MTEFLQQNANTYWTIKKILSIDSNDRDISKWPLANSFEVEVPVDYKNIVSLALDTIDIPSVNVFSNTYQNTKLSFFVEPKGWLDLNVNQALLSNQAGYTITITSGTYTSDNLALELQGRMNDAVQTYLTSQGVLTSYNFFVVRANTVSNKFIFGNSHDSFSFDFNINYDYNVCNVPIIFDQYALWGLGNYLGFDKDTYTATESTTPQYFYWSASPIWLSPTVQMCYVLEAPFEFNLIGDNNNVFMDLFGYNSIDEITPYTFRSSDLFKTRSGDSFKSKQNGKHDSAFAKINLRAIINSGFHGLTNTFFSDPPLERLQKLKIVMRYHNGMPVDFQNKHFTCTIAMNILRPDIHRNYSAQRPPVFSGK
jgi:hypothetical protein